MSFQYPPRAKKVEGVDAPMPYLCIGKPYDGFVLLRKLVLEKTGHDFLSKCGDMLRAKDFHSSKAGVANRSNHKTGRAFDYNQDDKHYAIVPEQQNGRIFFRTYIRCNDGYDGIILSSIPKLKIWQSGALVTPPVGRYFDFTNAAKQFDYERIPAWRSWHLGEPYSTEMEFWHYQCMEGLTWDEAMRYFWDASATPENLCNLDYAIVSASQRVLGRNDRGNGVRFLQLQLMKLGFLPSAEVDGVFGQKTYAAVCEFQRKHGLEADGLVGPATSKFLTKEIDSLSQTY